MSKRKIINIFILLFSVTLISCASIKKPIENKLAEKTWRATYTEKTFIVTKEEAIKNLLTKVTVSDEGERNILTKIAEQYFKLVGADVVRYGQENTCDQLQRKLQQKIFKQIEDYSALHSPFQYKISSFVFDRDTRLAGQKKQENISISGNILTANFNLLFDVSYDSRNKPRRYKYYGDASVEYKVTPRGCIDSTTTNADIVVSNASIKNPGGLIDQAHIEILWPIVEATLNTIVAEAPLVDARNQYDSAIISMINDFENARRNRYNVFSAQQVNLGERRYPVENNVALSRLQRSLKAYKFDEKNSRFTFTEAISPVHGYQWQNPVSKIVITANIFPEAGEKTAIVYEMTYEPITDTLTNETVFNEKDAVKLLNVQIVEIEKAIR